MNSAKVQLLIELNVSDLPTLTEIFKKFKVKTKPASARPSANEIEQMIIKKALFDAKAIDRGELKTKSFNNIADLMNDLKSEIEDDIFAHG
jgi:AAA+ superfamily predicted ATPase